MSVNFLLFFVCAAVFMMLLPRMNWHGAVTMLFVVLLSPALSRLSYLIGGSVEVGSTDFVMGMAKWFGLAFIFIYGRKAYVLMSRSTHFHSFPVWIGLFVLVCIVQTANPFDFDLKMRIWGLRDMVYWIGFLSLFIVVLSKSPVRLKNLERFFSLCAFLAVVSIAYSYYQTVSGFTKADQNLITVQDFVVDESIIDGPITIAGVPRYLHYSLLSYKYLVPLYVFVLGLLFLLVKEIRWSSFAIPTLYVILFVLALVARPERTLLVNVVVVVLVILVLRSGTSFKSISKSLVLVVFAAVTLGLAYQSFVSSFSVEWQDPQSVLVRRLTQLNLDQAEATTLGWRMERWFAVYLPRIAENPLGYGMGSCGPFSDIGTPHNQPIFIVYESGVLGFFFLSGALMKLLLRGMKSLKTDNLPLVRFFGLATIALIIINIVEGIPNFAFMENDSIFVAFIFSVFFAIDRQDQNEKNLDV